MRPTSLPRNDTLAQLANSRVACPWPIDNTWLWQASDYINRRFVAASVVLSGCIGKIKVRQN